MRRCGKTCGSCLFNCSCVDPISRYHDISLYFVDSSLVDELNEIGSEYEGSGETHTRLVYSLVPVPRSVQLSGLDSSIDKGALRNYFNALHRKVNMKRPLLVDDIQTPGNGFAVVGFRTVEGKVLHGYLFVTDNPTEAKAWFTILTLGSA